MLRNAVGCGRVSEFPEKSVTIDVISITRGWCRISRKQCVTGFCFTSKMNGQFKLMTDLDLDLVPPFPLGSSGDILIFL